MQWSAAISQIFGGTRGQALQLLSGIIGLIGVIYGLQVLMVERTEIPVCSAELLQAVGEQSFLRQQQLTIEVAGAVSDPGVWQLPVGSRMAEAVEKAGGFSQRADREFVTKGINLAETLTDSQKIYVPFTDENQATTSQFPDQDQISTTNTATTTPSTTPTGISINSATVDELDSLPGIGEARAADIVENRPYSAISELVSRGVLSQSVYDAIVGLISL